MFNQLHLQTHTARYLFVIVLATVALAALLNSTAHAQDLTASVTGRVFYQGIQPEAPILRAVVLVPVETAQPISVQTLADQFMVSLDDEGRFAFTGLAAGSYLLGLFRTENPDYIPVLDTSITAREDRGGRGLEGIPAVEISLRAGEQLTFDIPIVLPDFAATPQPTYVPRYSGSISGRITATGPAPGGQFGIELYPADVPQPLRSDDRSSTSVFLELNGGYADYTIIDLDDGEYFLIPPVWPLLIAPDTELVSIRYTLPPLIREQLSPEDVRGLTRNPEIRSYADGLSDEEIRQQIRDGALTFPVRVLRVRVANGQATTGVDFTLEYAEVQPAPLHPNALPSSGTAINTDDGGWSTSYIAAALAGLTALVIGAGFAVRLRTRRSGD